MICLIWICFRHAHLAKQHVDAHTYAAYSVISELPTANTHERSFHNTNRWTYWMVYVWHLALSLSIYICIYVLHIYIYVYKLLSLSLYIYIYICLFIYVHIYVQLALHKSWRPDLTFHILLTFVLRPRARISFGDHPLISERYREDQHGPCARMTRTHREV